MDTFKVKQIEANAYSDANVLHYDIEKGTPITKDHIISIILYCDFSEYCAKFSSTFRRPFCFFS